MPAVFRKECRRGHILCWGDSSPKELVLKQHLSFGARSLQSRISRTGLSIFQGCHFQVLPDQVHVLFMEVILEYSCLLAHF